ncbi:hypothetical protein [Longimicrobium sp.]|uniref:hypothetical protein n=1 Tax=Longimicrobium sp. TaxID=2029185 RepID=UPI003B3AEC76
MMLSFLALLGSLWITPPCEAAFCKCAAPADVPAAVAASDAVFTGRVLSVRDTTIAVGEHAWPVRRVTLRADRAWKGVESRLVVVLTGMGGGDCGFAFRRGESYLVYAHENGGVLRAGMCGRTAAVSQARADVHELGQPAHRWRRWSRGGRVEE